MRLGLLAATALLSVTAAAHADTFYTYTGGLTFLSYTFTRTHNASGDLIDFADTVMNSSASTLNNLYALGTQVSVNNTNLSLTAPGYYSLTGSSLFAQAMNAAAYTTQGQTNITFANGSQGSSTMAQIPAFLIASTLLPGQSAVFDVQFEIPTNAGISESEYFTTAVATTPEPASLLLLSTGLAGIAVLFGLRRRSLAGDAL